MRETASEFGLGGNFYSYVVRDAPLREEWRMSITDLTTALNGPHSVVYNASGYQGIPPFGISDHAIPMPVLELQERVGGSTNAIRDRHNAVRGIIPDGGQGIRLTAAAQEFMTGFLESGFCGCQNPANIRTIEWVGRVHALPASGHLISIGCFMDAATFSEKRIGLFLDDAGSLILYLVGIAFLSTPLSIPIDQDVHVVATIGPPNPPPNQLFKIYINGQLVASTGSGNITLPAGNVSPLAGCNAAALPSQFLDLTHYHLGFYTSVLTAQQVADHYAALQWTDVSNDVYDPVTLSINRGVRDVDNPTAFVAGPGMCTLAFNNQDARYSPGHTNQLPGFARGIPIRVTLTPSDGAAEEQFVGRVRAIRPTPGTVDAPFTMITAYDWMDEAMRFQLTGVGLMENVRADQVLSAIIGRMPVQPVGLEIDETDEIYPFAFHNAQDEHVVVGAELVRVESNEMGYVAVLRDGTLRCESRERRILAGFTPLLTLTDFLDVDVAETGARVPNRVLVTAHPTNTDPSPTTVLYALTNPLPIGPGETLSFTGPFRTEVTQQRTARIGGKETITPAQVTDYLMNTASAGTGTNLTAFLTVGVSVNANTVEWTLTNTSPSSAWITKLQLRGKGIYDFRTQTAKAEDPEGIATDGLNELTLDQPYIQDINVSQGAAEMLLDRATPDGRRARTVVLSLNDPMNPSDLIARDFGDPVTVQDAQSALDFAAHIHWVTIELAEGGQATVQWGLIPAETRKFWILGVAGHRELGINTRVFYL